MLKVGLTGGIASGKSTVRQCFEALGAAVVDADAVVRDLYRPGHAGHRLLVATYGDEILTASGEIDRAALSLRALRTAEDASRLNSLIHPLVIEQEAKWLASLDSSTKIALVEATLLIESGGRSRFDKIVVVEASPALQLQRAVSRGITREEAVTRMDRQLSNEERRQQADYIILNDGDLIELERRARDVYAQLVEDSETGSARRK